jgi:hypothetical protein
MATLTKTPTTTTVRAPAGRTPYAPPPGTVHDPWDDYRVLSTSEFFSLLGVGRKNLLTTLDVHGSFPVAATCFEALLQDGRKFTCRLDNVQVVEQIKRVDATLHKVSNGLANIGSVSSLSDPVRVPAVGTLPLPGTMGSRPYDLTRAFSATEQVVVDRAVRRAFADASAPDRSPSKYVTFLPSEIRTAWAGLSGVAFPNTVTTTSWVKAVTDIDVVTHEFGHALGLSHSAAGRDEYGDRRCFMGSDANVRRDVTTLNHAQTYYAGWIENVVYVDAFAHSSTFDLGIGFATCAVVCVPIVPVCSSDKTKSTPLPYPILVVGCPNAETVTFHRLTATGDRLLMARTLLLATRASVRAPQTFTVTGHQAALSRVWDVAGPVKLPDTTDVLPATYRVTVAPLRGAMRVTIEAT